MTESLRRHATRDVVIWYCGSNADLILHDVDEQNVERCINSSGWRSGCENEMVACILQNEVNCVCPCKKHFESVKVLFKLYHYTTGA